MKQSKGNLVYTECKINSIQSSCLKVNKPTTTEQDLKSHREERRKENETDTQRESETERQNKDSLLIENIFENEKFFK